MGDFTVEVGEIRTHAGKVRNLGDEVDTIAKEIGQTGIGGYLMYGVLVGAIAHPMLSKVAKDQSVAFDDLSDVLHSEAAHLVGTCEAYELVDDANAHGAATMTNGE